ncbi:MAG: mannosyltransferase, partial [Solirubrobacteraceae bacterium]|nr:mannosyltransferase [Solirubrobacteraceae bacterium]
MSTAVSDTRVARSADRILALPGHARRRPRAALAVVLGLAAVVYLASLGRSSMFIDEVFSWNASRHGLSGVGTAVRGAEVTPPLYYVLLHFWMALTGASGEVALRLPSALAGVGFVGAVAWLGTAVSDRRAGLTAGALAALTPLTFQYAQEVRAYIFVMLAVTVTAAAVVRLSQEPERRRWLVIAATAGAVSILLHYTAALVLAPVAIWLLRERQVPLRSRLAVTAAF